MPGIELHADFDRDGRLTRSADERAARLIWPGAILVANLDRDQRVLPSRVSGGDTPEPDYSMATAFSRDDELLPLEIRVTPGALGTGERLRIRCSGIMHTRIRLSDRAGIIVPHRLGHPEDFELPSLPPSGVLALTLQVRTIAGASFGRLSNLELEYRDDPREETRFELSVLRVDVLDRTHTEDFGRFSVAPFILDDRITTATRIYIVNTPENLPSRFDVSRAVAAASVPLVEVPVSLTGGDTWLQDQYQHAMMQGADNFRQLILHLPRLRHENSDETVTDNLEDFVNSHFRSRNIAMFNDLWDRVISVNTTDGGVLRINFRQIDAWIKSVGRLLRVSHQLDTYGALASPSWQPIDDTDWVDALRNMSANLRRLNNAIDDALDESQPERADLLNGLKNAAAQMVREAMQGISSTGSGDTLSVTSSVAGQSVSLIAQTARRLFLRGRQMHDAANYGGNIESTPPVPGAPLGKILIGNVTFPDGDGEFVDPDLLRLLAKQKKQPIVEINTSWLRVGHVDEMIAVVPHRSAGFSILHASSAAAMAILREAEARYRSGLSLYHPNKITGIHRPSGVLSRLMNEGSHPVTRLFRGKAWMHQHRPADPGQVTRSHDPPSIYLRLAAALGGTSGFNIHRIGFVPGEGPDRRYPADITPSEIIFAERDVNGESVNDGMDTALLEPSRARLRTELGVPVLPIPVLWDRVDNLGLFTANYWNQPTTAFSPDIVNMQVLNGHLLVPKPYGPRMNRDDAIYVVRAAMEAIGMPSNIRDRVGPRIVARRRMTQDFFWVERVESATLFSSIGTIRASYGGMETVSDVKAGFRDSFPGADDAELERRLIAPNRRSFDSSGYLRKDFTRLIVNDGMVDLFELFTAAVIDHLGVQLHFVDSWYYHIRDGQIHCGTNVLRRPRRLSGMNVWDAPDVSFRSQTIIFEDEVVGGTGTGQEAVRE